GRLRNRPLPFRLLLGDERTLISPAEVAMLEEKVRLQVSAGLSFVEPFRVLDWDVGVSAKSLSTDLKGRTINTGSDGVNADGMTHPFLHGLDFKRCENARKGIIICPGLL